MTSNTILDLGIISKLFVTRAPNVVPMSSSFSRTSTSAAVKGDEMLNGINLADSMQCVKFSSVVSLEEAKDVSDDEAIDKWKGEL